MGILIRTEGTSPSNVSLAAESGIPNPSCTLVDIARSTSACDIDFSSSTLLFFEDGFESLVALKITSSSFSFFWQSNIGSSRSTHLSDQIDRLMSYTRSTSSVSQLTCLISRCCISAPGNGLVSLDLRKPSPWPSLGGHV